MAIVDDGIMSVMAQDFLCHAEHYSRKQRISHFLLLLYNTTTKIIIDISEILTLIFQGRKRYSMYMSKIKVGFCEIIQ